MTEIRFDRVLRAAVLAGLGAGLLAAVFHLVLTEPLIDQAIALEEAIYGPEGADAPIVSRSTQRYGLVFGFAIYGVCWGLLLAGAYTLLRRWLPVAGPAGQVLLLAVLGYWALAALPFLKYPANPPGVGDPETIGYRQLLYLASIVLSVGSVGIALLIGSRLPPRDRSRRLSWLAAGGFLVVASVLLLAGLPANPDPVLLPADLIAAFRSLSLLGLTLFWLALGAGFAFLLRRASRALVA